MPSTCDAMVTDNRNVYTPPREDISEIPTHLIPPRGDEFDTPPKGQYDNIVAATLAALESGNLTPLVKEELKYTINARRSAQGKGELRVQFTEPEAAVLTPEEEEKVNKRRNQNKLAARRFREKNRQVGLELTKKTKLLESQNVRLMNEIRRLKRERLALQHQLEEHSKHCIYNVSNNT